MEPTTLRERLRVPMQGVIGAEGGVEIGNGITSPTDETGEVLPVPPRTDLWVRPVRALAHLDSKYGITVPRSQLAACMVK